MNQLEGGYASAVQSGMRSRQPQSSLCSVCYCIDVSPGECCPCCRLGDVPGIAGQIHPSSPAALCLLSRSETRILPHLRYADQLRRRYIPGLIDITVGSLDRPQAVTPALHYWDSQTPALAEWLQIL